MTIRGFYQFEKNGEVRTCRNIKFESTGKKFEDGKVIWRRIDKNGNPTNKFAEQFNPNMPWAYGKWFCKVPTSTVLKQYPELELNLEFVPV